MTKMTIQDSKAELRGASVNFTALAHVPNKNYNEESIGVLFMWVAAGRSTSRGDSQPRIV